MSVKEYLNKADQALSEAAEELTSLLRGELASNGWPLEQTLSVSVIYADGRFDYAFEGEHGELAQLREFGSEQLRPNPVIRRFFNREDLFQKVYLEKLEEQLGDLV